MQTVPRTQENATALARVIKAQTVKLVRKIDFDIHAHHTHPDTTHTDTLTYIPRDHTDTQ